VPPRSSARLADTLAGPLPPTSEPLTREVASPALIAEPAPASTRTLLAGAPPPESAEPAPDPEERRLSHELDFGKPDGSRSTGNEGGARRIILIVILVIIVAAIAAMILKSQIVAAVPALASVYAAVGL